MNQVKTGGSLIGKIGSYLQIVSKDPSSTAFVPLAEAYRQIGLLDDALEATKLGTRMLPHFSPGFATMGRVLGQMGRIDEAMSSYAKSLSIDRQCQAALVGLARLHLIRGERDQARKILCEAAVFHPDDNKISDMLIALDLPRPWSEIKLISESKPSVISTKMPLEEQGTPIPTATLAEIYVKQGLLDKAITVYAEILRHNPDNSTARERLVQLQAHDDTLSPLSEEQSAPVQESVPSSEPGLSQVMPVASHEEAPESVVVGHNEPQKQSSLAVFQRWLAVIKQGRIHV